MNRANLETHMRRALRWAGCLSWVLASCGGPAPAVDAARADASATDADTGVSPAEDAAPLDAPDDRVVPDGSLRCSRSALRFRGSGVGDIDRVKIPVDDPTNNAPGPPADVGATDFTIEFWLKGAAADNRAGAIRCGDNVDWIRGNIVIDRDRFSQDRKFGVSLGAGRVVWGVSGDRTGDRTVCASAVVLDDRWHHVAVQRRRRDGYLWIFVDGRLEAEGDGPDGDVSYPDDGVPGNHCGGPCLSSDPFLVLGAEKHDAGREYPSFNGSIDELRISRTLRYATTFTVAAEPWAVDSDTAALYRFEEASGDAIVDSAGNASPGVRRYGGNPPGPDWSTDTPFRCP
ncbi:MAG: LamG domain-containing protein [Myxococcales bacterium]|nr:LamG domain-containing protein [Myxococcales bacterium]